MPTEEVKAPDNQSVVGHVHPDQVAAVEAAAAAATGTTQAVADLENLGVDAKETAAGIVVEVPKADPAPAPAAPATESTGTKVATGIEIGLVDVNAVAKVVSQNFAGT